MAPVRGPARLDEPGVQRLDQQRVRSERGGDAGAQVGRGGGEGGQVALDVHATAQEKGYEDGPAGAEGGEGVGQPRFVELDVAEPYVEAGAQLADPVEERRDGAQGSRVAAAVGDDDERGCGMAGGTVGEGGARGGGKRGGGGVVARAAAGVASGLVAGSVPCDVAELMTESLGDPGEQLPRGVEGERLLVP
ncbi:hypothetical protein Y717_31995 [Streptomyces scopuliridis RB72]|uniref:Uncharacterized protein n=1 Tax=Streptomyces scopuliridis RB72 TaxID=1440053 RepID=A0A2T7T5S5_9ACTN|nr:hypothetical protein Y717_31995 [Streptomyces scopuliridis RB72]